MKTDSKPVLELVGQNGNAFMILGLANQAARKAGWDKNAIDEFMAEAKSGDYDHLLQTCMKYFSGKNPIYFNLFLTFWAKIPF